MRDPLSANQEARRAAEMHAPGVADAQRYLDLLRGHGCTITSHEDLSMPWRDVLVKRLAMYRSLRDTTIAKFGAAHFDAWDHTYRFFVGLFTTGKLGGARMMAQVPLRRCVASLRVLHASHSLGNQHSSSVVPAPAQASQRRTLFDVKCGISFLSSVAICAPLSRAARR